MKREEVLNGLINEYKLVSGRVRTCLNRGCVPSKMLVYTADLAQMVRHAGRFGIGAEWAGADWPAIRDRVFGRIDPLPDRAVAQNDDHRHPEHDPPALRFCALVHDLTG